MTFAKVKTGSSYEVHRQER